MRKLLAPSFAVLAFACLPRATVAQSPPEALPPMVPVWGEIETVESTAIPGPALWHITQGNSEVWILGLIGVLPKNVTWNSQPFTDLLTSSRAVIVPPTPRINILDIGWFLLGHCCSLFRLDSGKLDDILSEPQRLKLAALRESVGGDAKLYQGDQPLGAAQRLSRDFSRKYALDGEAVLSTVNRLAGQKDIRRDPAFRFDPLTIIREAIKLPPLEQRPCLDAAMEDSARMAVHAHPMAEAWAVGDIRGVKAHFAESRAVECLATAVKAWGAREQNIVPAFVTAIEAALKQPGKTIVVLGMGPLLRKDGVLERLEARGLKIEGPAE